MTAATAREPRELTDRQRELFEFIWDAVLSSGVQPTVREMGERFGILSPNGVECHLKALSRKGWIDHGSAESQRARGIRLLRRPDGRPFAGLTFLEPAEVPTP